jgi:O-acetylserine/cysteine efflux transporter
MSARELLVILLICILWGGHFSVMKVALSGSADPLFYSALRMTLIAVLLSPLLRIHKGEMKRLFLAGLCLGGLNYAFMFSGVKYANASVAAITIELYVPITMLLSVIFLKEHIGLPRIMGMLVAFAGVALIASGATADGMGTAPLLGISFLFITTCCEAVGAITIKSIKKDISPLRMLGWFAVVGSIVLWVGTLTFETEQLRAFEPGRREIFIPALLYSVFFASIVAHSAYYWLLKRLPVNRVAPLTLLATLIGVCGGVLLLGEPFTWQLLVGGLMTLTGVAIIIFRSDRQKKPFGGMPATDS